MSSILSVGYNALLNIVYRPEVLCGGILLVVSYFLYLFFLYPLLFSPLRSVPGPSWGHVLFGQFPAILQAEAGILQREWVKAYGPAVKAVGPFGLERLIFTKVDVLHKILVGDWVDNPRPAFMRNTLGFVAGYGLLTSTGNEHKQMRKAINPAFSISNLMTQTDMFYPPIEGLIELFKKQINSENHLDSSGKVMLIYDWMSKVTLDIICDTAFGYQTDSLHNPHNELAEAYEKLVNLQSGENIARFFVIISLPGLPRLLQTEWAYRHRHWLTKIKVLVPLATMLESMRAIRQISHKMLAQKIAEAELLDTPVSISDTESKKDIMSMLVRARRADMLANEAGERKKFTQGIQGRDTPVQYMLSDEAMVDQVLTFLGAGHETTASGLAWTLWLLANDKTSQDCLRQEVQPVYEATSRPDYRTLKNLKWLDCVIMESLRVMPPVPMTFRKTAKADYIDGIYVPSGTLLYIPIRVVNTSKEVWGEDAEDFKPSRWLNLPPTYHPTFSVLSFIAGPHACIGKSMAIVEMKAVLSALITHFEFEPAYKGQVTQPTAAITMKPKDSMPLRVKLAEKI